MRIVDMRLFSRKRSSFGVESKSVNFRNAFSENFSHAFCYSLGGATIH